MRPLVILEFENLHNTSEWSDGSNKTIATGLPKAKYKVMASIGAVNTTEATEMLLKIKGDGVLEQNGGTDHVPYAYYGSFIYFTE